MRAREPDGTGFVERDGVRVAWELFEPRDRPAPTIFLLPTWAIIHSRFWKLQVPYLARRYRVLTMDNRGNGRSDRPTALDAVTFAQTVGDCIAVMDATDTERAVIVGLSQGGALALRVAAHHPERVAGTVFIGPGVAGFGQPRGRRDDDHFEAVLDTDEGWAKWNRHFWLRDWRAFTEFFFAECFSEPHSTKPIEDAVAWANETDAETILRLQDANRLPGAAMGTSRELAPRVCCPTLVIHGTDDRIVDASTGIELAEAIGAELVLLDGSGHIPLARDPVRINLLLRGFVDRVTAHDQHA